MVIKVFFLLAFVLLSGCQTLNTKRDPASVGEFRLYQADILGIPYIIKSRNPVTIVFPRLNPRDFEKLRAAYGGFSRVQYQENRTYELVDFLPPSVQALIEYSKRPQPPEEKPLWLANLAEKPNFPFSMAGIAAESITIDQNCWGTSYAVTRLLQNSGLTDYTLFSSSQKQIGKLLSGHTKPKRGSDLSFGDWLFISNVIDDNGKKFLGHTALFIDKNLFFEKEGPGNKPWRLVTLSELRHRWPSTDDLPTVFEYASVLELLDDPTILSLAHNANEYGQDLAPFVPEEDRDSLIFSVDTVNPRMGGPVPTLSRIIRLQVMIDPRTQRGKFAP